MLTLTLTRALTRTLSRCALYFLADALIITSLREVPAPTLALAPTLTLTPPLPLPGQGMCEIAFEYIACQQKNHGVLILSEFVGAAQTLGPRRTLPLTRTL